MEDAMTEQPEAISPRIAREKRTIAAMVEIFCRSRHGTTGLCDECSELRDYALGRLDRCPFGADKPTCVRCPIHCYKPAMKEQVKAVMRFAGPRMLWRHPVLALMHQLDALRRPEKEKRDEAKNR
jgi:hypothetical protein